MEYERATAADAEELTRLRLAYLAEDLGPLSAEEASAFGRALPDYFRRSLGGNLSAYVAREGGKVVACALLLAVEKPMSPSFPNGRTGTVLNVYTEPTYRRRGVARRLMEMLLADARERGFCVVELKATEDGCPLYRSLGFEESRTKYRVMVWRCGQ